MEQDLSSADPNLAVGAEAEKPNSTTSTTAPVGHDSDELKSTAALIILIYLVIHILALAAFAFYPLIHAPVAEEGDGTFYLGAIQIQFTNTVSYVLGFLLGAVTVGALWQSSMRMKRTLILLLAGIGIFISILLYAILILWGLGEDLTQGPLSPEPEELKRLIAAFAWQNGTIFIAVLLGVFGGSLPDIVRRLSR